MNYLADMKKAKEIGIEAYKTELNEKITILEELLNDYNDGRRKSFYCLAVNLLELKDVNTVMEQIKNEIKPETSLKEKSVVAVRLFNEIAEQREISLKLRKK